MTKERAEQILGVDNNFYPYTKDYIISLFTKKVNSLGPNVSNNDLKELVDAKTFLLEDIDLENACIFSDSIKLNLDPSEAAILFDYILGISESELPHNMQQQANYFYFYCHSLVPDITFIQAVNLLGGVDLLLRNQREQMRLAERFNVPVYIIRMLLAELYLDEKLGDIRYFARSKMIARMRKSGELY